MDCSICCEVISGHNKPVECGFCNFIACMRCTERYLMDIHDDAHCMSCRKGWDAGILSKCLTQSFLSNKYKKHRKETLLDREKSLLPQTQPDVENTLLMRERKKLMDSLIGRKENLLREVRNITEAMNELRYTGEIQKENGVEGGHTTRKCPIDDCRGFLNMGWVCGICETKICKDCNEPKCEDHECDENTVETMKLLKKDSKPCPSCGMVITKIDGCDQMWCTQPSCHTAFSWRTGKKVFGTIHNPHFIQFSMQNGTGERNPQDIACGGLPDVYTFFNDVRRYSKYYTHKGLPLTDHFSLPIRGLRHIIHVEEPHYNVPDVRDTNTDLRVRYLLKEIDDDTFGNTIMNRDTARTKKKAFHDIVVMTMHTGADIANVIHALIRHDPRVPRVYDHDAINLQIDTMINLRKYANTQFKRVGELYKCKYPCIDDKWEFIRFV